MTKPLPLHSLEGLRFISSLGIVAFHFTPYIARVPFVSRFHLFVDLFFVISGIVIGQTYTGRIGTAADYLDFVKRRIGRLYPLHLATLAFYVAIGVMAMTGGLHVVDASKYNFSELVPNLLLIHAWRPDGEISFNYVSWSISAEFFVYLLFPVTVWLVARRRAQGLATVAILLGCAIVLSHAVVGRRLTSLDWEFGVLRAIPSFALGVWYARFHGDIARWLTVRNARLGTHAFAAATLVLMALGAHDYLVLGSIYALVGCAFLCDLDGRATFAAWRPLSAAGHLTYSIYMLHTVVATVFLSFVFPRLLGTTPSAVLASVLLSVGITLVLSVLSYRYFEDPLRRAINGLTLNRLTARTSGRGLREENVG